MNASRRKGEAMDPIYEEFDRLLKRLGDRRLESLIKEARKRQGDQSPLGAAAALECEAKTSKSKKLRARPNRQAITERIARALTNADDDLVATLDDGIVTKLQSRISGSVASSLEEMAEKVRKMDR